MDRDDAEELASWIKLRLIEDEYRVLRAFQGKSSLTTYLTTVVVNLARDYCRQRWGRWRPSAAAERLGTVGVQLEVLLYRDERTLTEAMEILWQKHGVELPATELEEMAAKLPARASRQIEGEAGLLGLASPSRTDREAIDDERSELLRRAVGIVEAALAELPREDRLLLKLRFIDGLTVAAIARGLGLEQRSLYPRIHKGLATLRRAVEAAGLDAADILEATGWAGAEVELDFGLASAEDPAARPSKRVDGPSVKNPP